MLGWKKATVIIAFAAMIPLTAQGADRNVLGEYFNATW